ncbi:uncharacterized protein EI90DRAFT_2902817 [Cantharellus anzutake]|uniref:uncharacterized protein n=1 Tax=Cantharellus anzutake TaxID=1750568 RepID=UPI001903BFA9|nr:uncharacterized protein EI90DRAFT_2902817 [Cantharellus anzutake]KAF8342825.1 hypothetical protein EI90DRAFT_2902817 [Cantharellus anzutake]
MQSTGSSNNFLTAAEQRALDAKSIKQSNEECYSFLLDRRDKDGNRPNDPNFDPRTLYIPKDAWKSFTPFEKQFWTIKQDQFDTVLFFQKGKFYELYENDAEIGHTEFDLKLTDRVKMKMVGVPEMSFDFWAAKFLARGYKVGRVDQIETSLGAEMRVAKKGGPKEIVRRELGKILTNGTLVDPNMLTDDQAGHLVSIREEEDGSRQFGLCILDASTSEFNLCEFMDDACGTKLETVIRQLRPKEILYTKGNLSVGTTRSLKSLLPGTCIWSPLRRTEGLGYEDTLAALQEIFPASPDSMDDSNGSLPDAIRAMTDKRVPMEALGAMIWYLRTLNLDKEMLTMKNFCIYDPMRKGKGLVLDGQTLAHVEILRNSEGTEEGSLLSLLGNCITPFGKRLFRIWLCMPLQDVKAINERLDAVDDIMDNPTCEDTFTSLARGMPDLERMISRIHAGSCKPKEFLSVLASFRRLNAGLSELENLAKGFKSRSISGLLRAAPDLRPYLSHIEGLFKESEEVDILVPVEGKDQEYDQIQEEIHTLENNLDGELEALRENICPDLAYWHSAVGAKEIYLVQAPSSFKGVPKTWNKSNSTKNFTRWIIPELVPMIRQLKEARETRKSVISDFKLRLYAAFDDERTVWLQAVKVMAELDCLFSLAKSSSSMGQPSCRTEFVESDHAFLEFEELRHLSIALKNDFIPNDIRLGGKSERIMLLTGPNMGGKSTAMRMTAMGVIMAQLGMYVPARKARLSPVDAILTRMGAYDNMFSNSSTFKVEMDECCKILREATPRSLVILDELGRGTSTYDGMAIAGAVLHQLATHTLALSCFATHYSSLTDDYKYHVNIRNMHMNTIVDEDNPVQLIFTYKLTNGVATSSFGTHVASLAGVPSTVVDRAEVVSKDFARQFQEKLAKKRLASTTLPLAAQADFVYLFKTALHLSSQPDANNSKTAEVLECLKANAARYVTA